MAGVMGLFKSKQPNEPQGFGGFNEDLADMVDKEYTRRQNERKPWELQWRLNMEFINGNQYLDINPVSQTLDELPKLYWHQEREVFNQMSTIIETRIARLTRQMPIHKVRPASSDDEHVSSAKVSTMLLNSTWHDQEMPIQYSNFVAWLEFNGTVFWKPVWSTRKGRIIYKGLMPGQNQPPSQLPPGQNPLPQQQQQASSSVPGENPNNEGGIETPDDFAPLVGQDQPMVEIREGEIDTAVVPAHEVFPDSCFRSDIRACRSIIHARAYHTDEIEEMWGVPVEPESVDVMTLQIASQGTGGMGYLNGMFRGTVQKLKNHAVVKEYYERPSKKYPQGRYIVVASKTTLHVGTMPFMVGQDGEPEFPLIRCTSIEHPGCFWGKTVAERCIPIQRRYNAFRNRKAEYLNLVAIGQWMEPEGSLDDDTELNNAPGNRIKYRPGPNGSRPEPVQFPSLPNSFEMEENSLLQEFTAVSGVSELSRFSEAPSGVKSGVALDAAASQDDTRVAVTATHIGNSVVQLGKFWLRLYRQFVQEPRVLRSVGPNRDVEVQEWYASDLKSDDVVLENASALSETPSQRRQMVFDLLNAGLFQRPELSNLSEEGRQKVFQMLEYGHWESDTEDMYWLQKNRARRENKLMLQGQPQNIQDFDDHAIHVEQHNRQRMQAEYDQLMQTQFGPIIDQMMRQHIAMHQQALQAQQGQPQTKPPSESISFKDLPVEGKIQMAQQAGIELSPQGLLQQQQMENQLKMEQAKASGQNQQGKSGPPNSN